MSPDEIQKLVLLAKRGDKQAFGLLYRHYFGRIYRYTRIHLFQDELAKDVCQEVFLRAWKALTAFKVDTGGTFQAFLFTVARNLIIDLSRKKKELSLHMFTTLVADESLEEQFDTINSRTELRRVLAQLTDVEREIVILRYFEELRHNEVAQIIGIAEGTLRVRIMRILRKLRSKLKP
jgi:RNA polymerase sigma-70 factor (ECF subfamily)